MKVRIATVLLALVLTAAFGQPFWGEHVTPSGGGGADPSISGDTVCVETTDPASALQCSHDATGAEILLVAACAQRGSGVSASLSGTTTAKYNSVSMSTPIVYVQSDTTSAGYPDCAMWLLASPSSGTNNVDITLDGDAYSGFVYAANLVDVVGTQDGDDAAVVPSSGTTSSTNAVTLTPSAAGNLLIHVATLRGNDGDPCSVNNLTKIEGGVTGPFAGTDLAYCISTGTAASTSDVTDTATFSATDRTASIGKVIK